jgi:hypothetical protein
MLIVPACRKCNGDFGRIEERLFLDLAGTLPTSPANDSVLERAIRGAEAAAGRSVRDVSYRYARGQSFLKRTSVASDSAVVETAAWTPVNFAPSPVVTPAGLHVMGVPTVKIDGTALDALIVKLFKGCYYAVHGSSLPTEIPVTPKSFTVDPRPQIEEMKKISGYRAFGKPPFHYGMVIGPNDPTTAIGVFVLWDHHCFFASSNVKIPSNDSEG